MAKELKGYQKYQLEWMIEHGYSLNDFIEALENYRKETFGLTLSELFEEWESYIGFPDSEIWACEDEWEDNEAHEENYISYNVGFINTSGMEDETQFDIPADAKQDEVIIEILSLFKDFCMENNIEKPFITYIEAME